MSTVLQRRANREGVGGAASPPSDGAATRAASTSGHRAANRVVDILELVAASRDGLALRQISAQLEAPKSSLLPLLRALSARRYLLQGPAGEYRLGPGALELGAGPAAHRDLADVAHPVLVDLMRRTGETVFLGTLGSDGLSVVYVDKVESAHIIRYAAGVGDRRPLHATSSGKALLAFLPVEQRERIVRALPLARHTERTVTSPAALRAALEEVQRAGVSVSLDEMVRGAAGVAAPIFDRDGRVAAVCTVAGPTERVRPQVRQLAAEVKRTAAAISALLGHRPTDKHPAGRLS
jgi:IclR family acetate operon transcriptional repressor